MELVMRKVQQFDPASFQNLKDDVIHGLSARGSELRRTLEDRGDLPIDYRFLELLITAPHDSCVRLGSVAVGMWVEPGACLPRFPA